MKTILGALGMLLLGIAWDARLLGQERAPMPQPLPQGPPLLRPPPGNDEHRLPAPQPILTPAAPASPAAEAKPTLPRRPPTPGMDPQELQRKLNRLKAERERLKSERTAAVEAMDANEPTPEKIAELRLRLGQLLGRFAVPQASEKRRPTPPPISTPPPIEPLKPTVPSSKAAAERQSTSQPVDSLALGRTLFRAHDYEGALRAFQQVNLTGLKPEERRPIEYLIASCLRHLGKVDEAAAIYRDVAGSKGDEVLAECAQWQLNSLRWQREFEQQLRQPQQHLQELEKLP